MSRDAGPTLSRCPGVWLIRPIILAFLHSVCKPVASKLKRQQISSRVQRFGPDSQEEPMKIGRRDNAIELLLEVIDQGYDRHAWHGTNLRGSIRGLTPKQAAWRPAEGRHNIWEIVIHAAYWKYAVRRRLLDEKRGTFPFKGSNWFPRPETVTAAAWRNDIALLEETHRSLRQAISQFSADALSTKTARKKFTNAALIYGAASHDIYHAGQIQLLKRLYSTR
jgi:uncharacterized damage-inducible protein DinB